MTKGGLTKPRSFLDSIAVRLIGDRPPMRQANKARAVLQASCRSVVGSMAACRVETKIGLARSPAIVGGVSDN